MYVCVELQGQVCTQWVSSDDTFFQLAHLSTEDGIWLGAQFLGLTALAWVGGVLIKSLYKDF